jgi:hypothetical protein
MIARLRFKQETTVLRRVPTESEKGPRAATSLLAAEMPGCPIQAMFLSSSTTCFAVCSGRSFPVEVMNSRQGSIARRSSSDGSRGRVLG